MLALPVAAEPDGLAGSCIFPRLAYWSLHRASRTRDKTRAHMRSFVYHTDPAVSPLLWPATGARTCYFVCFVVPACLLFAHGIVQTTALAHIHLHLSKPSPSNPHLRTLHRPHCKISVWPGPVQWLARRALWPVTSSLVPRYVRRQNFPMRTSISALVCLFPKYKKAAVAGSGWLTPASMYLQARLRELS